MSRIGKKPVDLPGGVTATVSGQTVEVKGPKGTRAFTATDDVTVAVEEGTVTVKPRGSSKRARQQWGLSRTQVANLVTGVTTGFKREMEITGVGYRALLPLSAILGAGFLVLADVIARTALSPAEIPHGVVTAFCGAPFFALVLRSTLGGRG